MRFRLLPPSLLALGALGLPACGNETTQPNPPADQVPIKAEAVVASNTWITRADMLTSRTDLAVATVTNAAGQSVVYAIGGRNPNGVPLAVNAAYNVATNTWTFRRGLPIGLAWTNGAGVINGKIYVSGGILDYSQEDISRALYVYDPATNTWTRKRDMPSMRGSGNYVGAKGATGVINGKLYVVTQCYLSDSPRPPMESGCYDDREPSPAFFRYNPVTDQWASLPSPASAFGGTGLGSPLAGGVIDGKFYVMGQEGDPRYYFKARFAVYDPSTNRWTPKRALDLYRPGAGTAVLQSKLYVIGGGRYVAPNRPWEAADWNSVYDPTTDAWTRRAALPGPRTGIAATKVFLNGQPRIEVVGGNRPGNNLQFVP